MANISIFIYHNFHSAIETWPEQIKSNVPLGMLYADSMGKLWLLVHMRPPDFNGLKNTQILHKFYITKVCESAAKTMSSSRRLLWKPSLWRPPGKVLKLHFFTLTEGTGKKKWWKSALKCARGSEEIWDLEAVRYGVSVPQVAII